MARLDHRVSNSSGKITEKWILDIAEYLCYLTGHGVRLSGPFIEKVAINYWGGLPIKKADLNYALHVELDPLKYNIKEPKGLKVVCILSLIAPSISAQYVRDTTIGSYRVVYVSSIMKTINHINQIRCTSPKAT